MTIHTRSETTVLAISICLMLTACSSGSNNASVTAAASCDITAAQALQACIGSVNTAQAACYSEQDSACDDGNADIIDAQATLQSTLKNSCTDGECMGLSVDAAAGRLQADCKAQPDSIAWRTFGGPQGAVWPSATPEQRDCLQTAHETVSQFFDDSLIAINTCLGEETCDASAVASTQKAAAVSATATITAACPALADLIAVEPDTYVAMTEDQIDCSVAVSHGDVAPFEPTCGPSNVDVMPARGEWSMIVLDGDKWGTMCGDGTDYAIHIRLAPDGYPVDNVIAALEGGGVCLFEDDCRSRIASSPQLFNAQDPRPPGTGIVSDDTDNPFANWTKVYLPYCNQDVFMGGGVFETFSDFEVPRYGAVNLRAGMRVTRDIIWNEMDAAGGAGFRPDQLTALFGGFSAGAYGTIYNYHFVLDILQWARTAAFPDAGGALDNGTAAGVRSLGPLKIPAWGVQPYLPSYCFIGDCAVGPDLYRAMSPRLLQVPEQQMLILSNQKDNTQQRDAFFTDEAQWINAMRSAYCDTKNLPGIQWYLTSDSINSVHVVTIRPEFYYAPVAGEVMADWFLRAVEDPTSLTDRAEEGNFVIDIPGSLPFPCTLP
jgi:hypothetical protein